MTALEEYKDWLDANIQCRKIDIKSSNDKVGFVIESHFKFGRNKEEIFRLVSKYSELCKNRKDIILIPDSDYKEAIDLMIESKYREIDSLVDRYKINETDDRINTDILMEHMSQIRHDLLFLKEEIDRIKISNKISYMNCKNQRNLA